MRDKMKFLKKIFIPSGEKTELPALENWIVRYRRRYGLFSTEWQYEAEVFTNEKDAQAFAEALKDAFRFIKNTADNKVSIEKTKQ
jgi:hypothetical protein